MCTFWLSSGRVGASCPTPTVRTWTLPIINRYTFNERKCRKALLARHLMGQTDIPVNPYVTAPFPLFGIPVHSRPTYRTDRWQSQRTAASTHQTVNPRVSRTPTAVQHRSVNKCKTVPGSMRNQVGRSHNCTDWQWPIGVVPVQHGCNNPRFAAVCPKLA